MKPVHQGSLKFVRQSVRMKLVHQGSRMWKLDNIFNDPSNANALMECVLPPPTSLEAFKSVCSQWETNLKMGYPHRKTSKEPLKIRLGADGRSRGVAFLAALYLHSRLTMKEENLRTWCPSPTYDNLYVIAKEIRCTEPSFRDYNPSELVDYFEMVIMYYRDLVKKLRNGAYPNWEPTRFSNIARELSILDYNSGFDKLRRQRETYLKRKHRAAKESRRLGGLSPDELVSPMVTRSKSAGYVIDTVGDQW
ncbi:MAG: hypothetical protein J3Q66DRAFT_392716 [Benniella sp.]|nr:MAG: hypothetical protein J3Q66DRAFT_392716 [Benniella sp.]